MEQKMAAFRFHITRMHTVPLDSDKKKKEWDTIQLIAKNNSYAMLCIQQVCTYKLREYYIGHKSPLLTV